MTIQLGAYVSNPVKFAAKKKEAAPPVGKSLAEQLASIYDQKTGIVRPSGPQWEAHVAELEKLYASLNTLDEKVLFCKTVAEGFAEKKFYDVSLKMCDRGLNLIPESTTDQTLQRFRFQIAAQKGLIQAELGDDSAKYEAAKNIGNLLNKMYPGGLGYISVE